MEMTSKEALDKLNNFISREKHINSERNKTINECINTIKQDLERLEALEKENQELRKITQKMLNGLNNIVECKPKQLKGFILLFIETFEELLKEVLQ